MKNLLYIATILLASFSIGQSRMYITTEVEGGVLKTKYNVSPEVKNSIVDNENSNYSLKATASFLAEWDQLAAEVGIGQGLRIWEIEGEGSRNNQFYLKHKQLYPVAFVGGYYRLPLSDGEVNLNLYMGSRFEADFVNYNALNSREGIFVDHVLANTKESNKINFNIIPEIGLKGYFESENFWQIGIRYYFPLNGDVINGEIIHFNINKRTPTEVIPYSVAGETLGVFFRYGFKLYN